MPNDFFKLDSARALSDEIKDVYIIKPVMPVQTGATGQTWIATPEPKHYWIDYFGVIPITIEKAYENCGFYLGRRVKEYHRPGIGLLVAPDEYDDYWKIFDAGVLTSLAKTATNILPFGGNTMKQLISDKIYNVDGSYFHVLDGPGYDAYDGLESDIKDGARDLLLSNKSAEITEEILDFMKLAKFKYLAKSLPYIGQIISLGAWVTDADGYGSKYQHDSIAFRLCEKNNIKLEGSYLDFYENFLYLRYFMEQYSMYFYAWDIDIIKTYPYDDSKNIYFKNISPYKVDLNVSSGKKNIDHYLNFYRDTLLYLKMQYNLNISLDLIDMFYVKKFKEYLADYQFRLDSLDEIVKIIFR